MLPRVALLRLWTWRDCVRCVIAQRQLRSSPDDRRIVGAAGITSYGRVISCLMLWQRVLLGRLAATTCGMPNRTRSATGSGHIPARLVHHARQRVLKNSPDWPWEDAFLTCRQGLCAMPAPA
jgi:hypothetical protein